MIEIDPILFPDADGEDFSGGDVDFWTEDTDVDVADENTVFRNLAFRDNVLRDKANEIIGILNDFPDEPAPLEHNHDTCYSKIDHGHPISEIINLNEILTVREGEAQDALDERYALLAEVPDVYNEFFTNLLNTTLEDFADIDHRHNFITEEGHVFPIVRPATLLANGLFFTHQLSGSEGNDTAVEFIQAVAPSTPLSASWDGSSNKLTITLPTDSDGDPKDTIPPDYFSDVFNINTVLQEQASPLVVSTIGDECPVSVPLLDFLANGFSGGTPNDVAAADHTHTEFDNPVDFNSTVGFNSSINVVGLASFQGGIRTIPIDNVPIDQAFATALIHTGSISSSSLDFSLLIDTGDGSKDITRFPYIEMFATGVEGIGGSIVLRAAQNGCIELRNSADEVAVKVNPNGVVEFPVNEELGVDEGDFVHSGNTDQADIGPDGTPLPPDGDDPIDITAFIENTDANFNWTVYLSIAIRRTSEELAAMYTTGIAGKVAGNPTVYQAEFTGIAFPTTGSLRGSTIANNVYSEIGVIELNETEFVTIYAKINEDNGLRIGATGSLTEGATISVNHMVRTGILVL